MKNLGILLICFIGFSSNAQNYFNTIEAEKKEIRVKIDTTKNVEFKEKNKLYYTYKLKSLSEQLKQSKVNYSIKDSINKRNISYFKEKIISARSKKKDEAYMNEIDLIREKEISDKLLFELEQSEIKNKLLRTKDTLYKVIKKEISNKHSSINNLEIPNNFKPPVKGKIYITSKYGNRIHPITKENDFHSGIDIRANNQEIFSVMPGKVTKVNYDKKLGIYVEVTHENEYKSIYGHLSEILVLEDTLVDNDTIIGISGNTGRTNAPHLHFVMKKGNKHINTNPIFSTLL